MARLTDLLIHVVIHAQKLHAGELSKCPMAAPSPVFQLFLLRFFTVTFSWFYLLLSFSKVQLINLPVTDFAQVEYIDSYNTRRMITEWTLGNRNIFHCFS